MIQRLAIDSIHAPFLPGDSSDSTRSLSDCSTLALNARPRFLAGLKEALILGLLVGLAHLTASGCLRTWLGIRFAWLDLPISGIIVCLTSIAGFTLLWLASWPLLPRSTLEAIAKGDLWARRLFLRAALLAYAFSATFFIYHLYPAPAAWLLDVALLAALFFLWRFLRSRLASSGVLSNGLFAMTFLCQGTTVWVAVSPQIRATANALQFGLGLLLPPALCVGILILRRRHTQTSGSAAAIAISSLLAAGTVIASVKAPELTEGWMTVVAPEKAAPKAGPPNIILIVLDTVSARHLELFGYAQETMPNLTRYARRDCQVVMASESVSSCTVPAHGSMLTGLWPSVHGGHAPDMNNVNNLHLYSFPIRGDVVTLPEYLGAKGYRCGAIAANYAVLSGFGISRGFDDFDARPGDVYLARKLGWVHAIETRNLHPGAWLRDQLPEFVRQYTKSFDRFRPPYRTAEQITALAHRWLERHGDRPYFLMLNLLDAHDPYLPKSGQSAMLKAPPEWVGFPDAIVWNYMFKGVALPDGLVQYLRTMYESELHDLDQELSKFLDYLRARPEYDNTMVIITSDHGDEFMEHHLLRHSNSAYESVVSVPMIVRLPRSCRDPAPAVSATFQQVDLPATIASVIGDPSPSFGQGKPWGRGREYTLCEVYPGPIAKGSPWIPGDVCAVRIDRFKYLRISNGTEELYDLAADPGEQHNILSAQPDILRRARDILAERDAWPNLAKSARPNAGDVFRLRSLGYVN